MPGRRGFAGVAAGAGLQPSDRDPGQPGSRVAARAGWSGLVALAGWSGFVALAGWSGLVALAGWSGLVALAGWPGVAARAGWSGAGPLARGAGAGGRPGAGAAVPGGASVGVHDGQAPAVAGLGGDGGGEPAASVGVEGAVAGGFAGAAGQPEPGGQGDGEVHRPGQPWREPGPGRPGAARCAAGRPAAGSWPAGAAAAVLVTGGIIVPFARPAVVAVPAAAVPIPVTVLVAGQEGIQRLAGQQGDEHLGTQLFKGAFGPGGLESPGGGVDSLVGGQHIGGRQVPTSQCRGAAAFGPGLDTGVFLRPLPPLPRGFRVGGQDLAVQHGVQFPGRQP